MQPFETRCAHGELLAPRRHADQHPGIGQRGFKPVAVAAQRDFQPARQHTVAGAGCGPVLRGDARDAGVAAGVFDVDAQFSRGHRAISQRICFERLYGPVRNAASGGSDFAAPAALRIACMRFSEATSLASKLAM